MGYHEDLETRAAFLKVLSNILRQGTEFDSLSHEGDKYDKLVEVMLIYHRLAFYLSTFLVAA